jgi:hypothetical protein
MMICFHRFPKRAQPVGHFLSSAESATNPWVPFRGALKKPHTQSCLVPRSRKFGYAGANVGNRRYLTRIEVADNRD